MTIKSIYIPNWVTFSNAQLASMAGVDRLLWAFSGWASDGSLAYSDVSTIAAFVAQAKSVLPTVKVLVSFGGYDANMAGLVNMPTAAAGSAAWLVRETGADGIDLDWEYPGQSTTNTTVLAQFASTFRMDAPAGTLLTAAVSVDPTNFAPPSSDAGTGKWDELHIMTYDWAGSWVSTFQHNTSLVLAKKAVQAWIDAGYHPAELSIGVPFYGKSVQVTAAGTNAGLNQPTSNASWWQTLTYDQIAALDRTQYTQQWDALGCAPWLWNPNTLTAVTYCDKYEIQWFKNYCLCRGLQGVFAWCEGQDDASYTLTTSLLSTIPTPGLPGSAGAMGS